MLDAARRGVARRRPLPGGARSSTTDRFFTPPPFAQSFTGHFQLVHRNATHARAEDMPRGVQAVKRHSVEADGTGPDLPRSRKPPVVRKHHSRRDGRPAVERVVRRLAGGRRTANLEIMESLRAAVDAHASTYVRRQGSAAEEGRQRGADAVDRAAQSTTLVCDLRACACAIPTSWLTRACDDRCLQWPSMHAHLTAGGC